LALGKRLYDLAERLGERAEALLHPYAFPGRGRPLPPIMLITLPKSGSIFIHGAIRRTLRVPMLKVSYSITFGTSFDYERLRKLAKGNAVCREHFTADDFLVDALRREGIRNIVLHIRDPRSAVVSWTRNMDRSVRDYGITGAMLHCQQIVPDEYKDWDFHQRLSWQVEHTLPRYVAWIADWLALIDRAPDVKFLVTTYEEFAADNRGFVERLLKFFGVPYEPSWISIPNYRVGHNNVFHVADKSTRDEMGDALYRQASGMIPEPLLRRFGWPDDSQPVAKAG
jgi:hypothetical protein